MLNISSTQPVIWPTAPPSGVASVPAVTAVPSSARDTQTSLDQGREQTVPTFQRRGGANTTEDRKDANMLEPAPLLPRESPEAPNGQALSETTDAKAEAQAEEKARKRQLQDVLSDVWKASGAVVDVVLGREAPGAESADPATANGDKTRAAALQATLASPGAQGPAANDALLEQTLAASRSPQDVMAYDAQGNSSWVPLEAGSLISRRV